MGLISAPIFAMNNAIFCGVVAQVGGGYFVYESFGYDNAPAAIGIATIFAIPAAATGYVQGFVVGSLPIFP